VLVGLSAVNGGQFVSRAIVSLALALALAWAGVIGLIHAQPYQASSLNALLAPPQDCRMPCFLGIRPGITSFDHALELLQSHAWVADVRIDRAEPYRVTWRWSGAQPALFDGVAGGILYRDNYNMVTSIKLQTVVPYATVWFELGVPEMGYVIPQRRGMLHGIYYSEPNVYVINFTTCPAHLLTYWQNNVVIQYGDAYITMSSNYARNDQVFRMCR
jgi:hypothetical protein